MALNVGHAVRHTNVSLVLRLDMLNQNQSLSISFESAIHTYKSLISISEAEHLLEQVTWVYNPGYERTVRKPLTGSPRPVVNNFAQVHSTDFTGSLASNGNLLYLADVFRGYSGFRNFFFGLKLLRPDITGDFVLFPVGMVKEYVNI